ncbi:glycosyltransferase family 1 protein [Sphingomonas sp. BK235]|jgi:phosphatidylinositol alpha 1,6-mannosyltransferase|uniref:glycosyltransferase family 4 protein n=1 Tax=Sphingomonas sp. BK235 TaxID=2512131 RepID=UPI001053B605|nr:glycosyltransferase family 1 protein [Sphingomonas sp. BK235]TCP37182.1 glycosyltransferase involved in cell wall biosynthesis [Sphingomonas sp. BK235]
MTSSPAPDVAQPRVAFFSGNYNYVRDGANQAQNLLVGHLLDRGVAVRVYSPTTPTPAFEARGTVVDVPAIPIPGGRGEYKLGRGLPCRPRRDLEAFAPDLVHVSAPEFLGHAAVSWARARGIPVVSAVHTRFETYFQYYGLAAVQPAIKWILRRFYDRADRVLVPTPSMAEVIRSLGVTTPIALWGRGVNHRRFHPGARDLAWRRSLGIGDDELAIGFLGRLVLEKGLGVFAEVLARLDTLGVKHRVLIVGKGPARDWFAERVPLAAFAGFQSGDDLGRAVASMDLLFNPSVTETWGQVTSEAMAAGVPVVAARATGAVDLLDDGVTGLLVPPQDIQGYASAIATLARDPARRRAMGAAAHERAKSFRWDTANEAVLDVYRELLARR